MPLILRDAVLEHTNYRRGGSADRNLKFTTVSLTSAVQLLALWLVLRSSRFRISDGIQTVTSEVFVICRRPSLRDATITFFVFGVFPSACISATPTEGTCVKFHIPNCH